jgi:hypothetical protein
MNRIRQITLFALGVLMVVVLACIHLFEPVKFVWAAMTVWVLLLRWAFTEHPVLFWSYVLCCVVAVMGYRSENREMKRMYNAERERKTFP